jgi:hypothetical protein
MSDGGPQRSVIVSGQDWGKLWMIHGVWMEVAVSQEVPLLTTYQLQAALGIETSLYGVGAFMQQMTNLVINRKIKEMQAFSDPAFLPLFSCNPPSGIQGLIAPAALGLFQRGPFWNIIKGFSDSPRNELWISDSDATGPTLVLRPTPYKDINGNWIGGATDPGTINLDQIDIVAIDAGRSDEKVANFFWTSPGNSEIFAPNQVHAGDILAGDPFDFNYTNNNPSLFGYREMQWPTSLIPNTVAAYPLKQAPAQQLQSAANIVTWHKQRGELLKAMNRDNVVFEDVAITARGSEAYQVGQYLQVTRNKVVSQCYLTRLAHVIQPFGSWETTLYGERGTGFLVRNKMEQSPFWAEGRPGVYARASSTSTAA